MATTEEPAETTEETAVRAVSDQAEAQARGLSLRADRARAAAAVTPRYFTKRRQNMAILEKATNHYYKINYDRCAVRGLKVFVNFSVYIIMEEREKEKQREGKWAEFFQKLRESLHSQYTALLAAIEEAGLTPEQVMSETEEGKIDAENYPALRVLQDKMNALEPYEKAIGERLFRYRDNEMPALAVLSDVEGELGALSFEEEWITAPILLNGGGEVCAGDYSGESMTYEFFYERLKSVMGETEDC